MLCLTNTKPDDFAVMLRFFTFYSTTLAKLQTIISESPGIPSRSFTNRALFLRSLIFKHEILSSLGDDRVINYELWTQLRVHRKVIDFRSHNCYYVNFHMNDHMNDNLDPFEFQT